MTHAPHPDLASVAAMIGQPSRAAMLTALLSGRWLTARELADEAGVAASTATEHLARLVEAGLVRRRASGRWRYHALAGPGVASALEALTRLHPPPPTAPDTLSPAERALRFARTCYDHLAGTLGVRVTDALVDRGLVAPTGAEVTAAGDAWLEGLGVDPAALRSARRTHVRFCLDWSERRDHLAGAVGAALTETMLARGWLARMTGTRAVRLTVRGREGLYRALGLDVAQPSGANGAGRDLAR